jgi:hypothetical protein
MRWRKMDYPLITRVRNWWKPPKPAPEIPPTPAPEPEAPPVTPPAIKPSRVQFVNYLRAIAILRSIPFTAFLSAFLKLPLRRIAYAVGLAIWLYMSYVLFLQLFDFITRS